MHIPVLLKEILEHLSPKPGQNFIDATVGNGGHMAAILEKIAPNGKLLAIDRDPMSLTAAKFKVQSSKFKNNVIFVNSSFGDLQEIVSKEHFESIKGILFDFGMSSEQLENSGKGFSFQKDEIMDMRFDPRTPMTAEDIVNGYSEKELAEIFEKFGEESRAWSIARAIAESRRRKRIKTTLELTGIIEKVKRRFGRIHPATQIFQALRIEVNQELVEIERALAVLPEVLAKGSRAAFISFHSLEDRIVKNWSRDFNKKNIIKNLTKKPIASSAEEVRVNPRSRSAKLRVIEKI